MFDHAELERLAELVRNADISEITLKLEGHGRITIRKEFLAASRQATALVPIGDSPPAPAANGNGIGEAHEVVMEGELPVEEEDAQAEETFWITSPLVGRFHPVKPLVGLGARVTRGQVVGTIDAVKLIHEITADADGVILDVLVEDGMPVEYGQPLFLVQEEVD
jgi:biotin carboxyl carrier protein